MKTILDKKKILAAFVVLLVISAAWMLLVSLLKHESNADESFDTSLLAPIGHLPACFLIGATRGL